jgi:fatty-acid desaturase
VLGGYQHARVAHSLTTFNNWAVALLTAGEGFHHNHHWKQRSARFAQRWWEMPADWGYWAVIRPLEALKLAARVRRDLPAAP